MCGCVCSQFSSSTQWLRRRLTVAIYPIYEHWGLWLLHIFTLTSQPPTALFDVTLCSLMLVLNELCLTGEIKATFERRQSWALQASWMLIEKASLPVEVAIVIRLYSVPWLLLWIWPCVFFQQQNGIQNIM